MNKKFIVVSWVLVVLQAILIFYFSSKPSAESRDRYINYFFDLSSLCDFR